MITCRQYLLFALLLVTGNAYAWRCDTWIIEPGQSRHYVQFRCGEPDGVEKRTEWRMKMVNEWVCWPGCAVVPVMHRLPVEVETWYYDSPDDKVLTFENGFLETVD